MECGVGGVWSVECGDGHYCGTSLACGNITGPYSGRLELMVNIFGKMACV